MSALREKFSEGAGFFIGRVACFGLGTAEYAYSHNHFLYWVKSRRSKVARLSTFDFRLIHIPFAGLVDFQFFQDRLLQVNAGDGGQLQEI